MYINTLSRTKFENGRCGHLSTEEYLNDPKNFLQCCGKCLKKMGKHDIEEARKRLEAIRRELAIYCGDCGRDVEPLEEASVLLGVFWNNLEKEKAKELTLQAHHRHAHTDYDEKRLALEEQGLDGRAARNIVRYGTPE